MATIVKRPPVVGLCVNPVRGLRPEDMRVTEAGRTIASLVAEHCPKPGGLLIVKLNDEIVSRLTEPQRAAVAEGADLTPLAMAADNWSLVRVSEGDVVALHDLPGNREVVRGVLGAAAVLATIIPGLQAYAPYLYAAAAAYNILVPPRQAKPGDKADNVYAASLSGNQARLDDPIWKICGRVKITPPFAHTPYGRFEPKPGETNPEHNRDQYAYVLLCLGLDDVLVEKALIANTSIQHFQDVIVAAYRAPGVQPVRVKANTYAVGEVSSSELSSEEVDGVFSSRYVGGFAATPPGDRAVRVSVDVIADQGLGKTDDSGGSHSRTAEWQVEQRSIDDFGRPASDWVPIANEARTDDTNTEQRWTSDYDEAAPVRPEIRLVRTDIKATKANVRDGISWVGLRAELERPAPLHPSAAHYEIVMRASDQLSQQTQNGFAIIVRGKCRQWNHGLGWAPLVESRNPAWWALDLLRGPVLEEDATLPRWGLNLPDNRIDLEAFAPWAATCDARQDHFDYAFTDTIDAWEALQLICRAGRARPFRRNGLVSVVRDEWNPLPVAAFTPRNCESRSISLQVNLPTREQPDGVVMRFLSNVTWQVESVECPCVGYRPSGEWGTLTPHAVYDPSLPVMVAPVFQMGDGITGSYHAEREGLYNAANLQFRRSIVTCTTQQAAALAYMDPVRVMPEWPGYGQSGDVVSWDADTLTMTLSEPVAWGSAPLYLTLRRDDTTLTTPVLVTQGTSEREVILPSEPDFLIVTDAANRERPQYLLGTIDTSDELCKVAAREDGGLTDDGLQLYDLTLVVDDERVHTADAALLPGPSDVQDPIDSGTDYPDDSGGGFAVLVRLRDHQIYGGSGGTGAPTGGQVQFLMHNDGSASWEVINSGDLMPGYELTGVYRGEWLNQIVTSTTAGLYEVFAEDLDGGFANLVTLGAIFTGTLGSWLNLSTDHTWTISADAAVQGAAYGTGSVTGVLRLRVRRVGGTTILVTRNIFMTVVFDSTGAGDDADGDSM